MSLGDIVSGGVSGAAGSVTSGAGGAAGLFSSINPVGLGINIALIAVSIGAQYFLKKDQDKKSKQQQDAQLVVQTAIGPRIFAVGRVRLGGAIVFAESNMGSVYLAIVHCEGPVYQFRRRWLDEKDTQAQIGTLVTTNFVFPWGSAIVFGSHLGTATQAAEPMLTGNFPPSVWSTAHRLRGVCYTAMLAGTTPERIFQKVYPGGTVPTLQSEIDGAIVYDPRDVGQDWDDETTWEWADNASLAVLFFLVHPQGFGFRKERIDLTTFTAFANVCDQAVPLKAGGSEPRYRLWGTWAANEERRAALERFLDACDAELYTTREGLWGIRGGVWEAPTVTLTDADVLEVGSYEQGNETAVAFNLLRAKYTSAAHDYQEVEAEPWEDLASQALYGELSQEIALPMSPSHGQTRRLMKIATAKRNPRHKLTLVTKLSGLMARRQRFIRITLTDLATGGAPLDATFRVERFSYDPTAQTCSLGVASFDAAAYDWNAATEEGNAAPVPVASTFERSTEAGELRFTEADAVRYLEEA